MYSVYALYSPTYSKIYIGYTSNLEERLKSHIERATKGYTIKFRPWKVLYTEEFDTKGAAMRREKQLKSAKGRVFIWGMIKKD